MTCATRRRLAPASALLLLLAAPGSAAAGAPAPPRPGDRVRFEASPDARRWTEARVVEVEDDALVVRLHPGGPATRVPFASVQELEVRRARRRWPEGAAIGFVPGFAFGAWVGNLLGCDDQGPDCRAWKPALAAGAMVGGMTAAAGALVGLLVKTERWVQADVPGRRGVELRPVLLPRGGAGVAVRF